MSRKNKTTYMAVADSYSQTIALALNNEDVKTITDEITTIYRESGMTLDETDEAKLDEYYAKFEYLEDDATYNRVRDHLRALIKDNEVYIWCTYLVYMDLTNDVTIYLCDSSSLEDSNPIGYLEDTFGFQKDNERGFPAYESNYPEYGWLVTAGYPVKYNNETVAYALVDIKMATVRSAQASSIVRLTLYELITINLLAIAGIILVYYMLIKPLRKITSAASNYNSQDPVQTHEQFQNLKIKNRDEIGTLSDAIKKMEDDVNARFIELSETNKQLISSREQTKQMSILANKDGLTGVKNKIAYNNEVARINQDIKNKEKVEFAVSMIDLNYLKNTNDEFGHDTGDTILVKLSQIICDVFAHSPVYRVGGDEFVVISSGKDYKNIDNLVKEFEKRIEEARNDISVIESERVWAAIGYSIFDPKKDDGVDDVFKRADKDMYNKKRAMKSENK